MSDALSPPAGHGVAFKIDTNNRNRIRSFQHSLDPIRRTSENHLALESNELVSESQEGQLKGRGSDLLIVQRKGLLKKGY